jgi:Na+/melibiose symporter-like transporter
VGVGAGALNLAKVAGAGLLTVVVLQFMARYDSGASPQWMWYAIILMSAVLVVSALWTVTALKRASSRAASAGVKPVSREALNRSRPPNLDRRTYAWFLFSLAFVIAAMSSMQVYALFFLQDVVGLANPADEAARLVIVVGLATALTVYPAGMLADRIGRDRMMMLAGGLGALGAAILLSVNSLTAVLLDGVIIGMSVGMFLSGTWVLANDMVSSKHAARDLGLTSIAILIGSSVARVAGVGIDALNSRSPTLGYQVMLISIAIAFVLAAAMLTYVSRRSETVSPVARAGADAPV